ncbi:plasmid mobilization relaxosome protein MobC [Croceibacterium ferulae]|uniref:plasmid mobilization relaxosome protein MobC n=1 Tax=Croceibacterium ferulae TaxID=1854641 RepID=UPI000EAE55BF|nr:plasmid mobilization relaxosome protein MobC [Croceibacterium ferulae]
MSDKRSFRRPAPFSLRLTPEERLRLERDAGHQSVSAYIKSRLFDGAAAPVRTRGLSPVDRAALAEALAKLGQSRIANNLNQLARAANVGALDLTPELEAELQEACAAVLDMRALLVQAVGLSEGRS